MVVIANGMKLKLIKDNYGNYTLIQKNSLSYKT